MKKYLISIGLISWMCASLLRADCGHLYCPSGVEAIHVKCWAACLEFLSCEYGDHYTQCDFGTYACLINRLTCDSHPPGCICYGEDNPCWCCSVDNAQYHDVMEKAGFGIPPNWDGPLPETDVEIIICEGWEYHILTVHETDIGHAMVINQYNSVTGLITYMDSNDGMMKGSDYAGYLNHIDYGEWKHSMMVDRWEPSDDFRRKVGIGDIASFGAYPDHSDPCKTNLEFYIIETADPDERSAVYIADNPLGPARLIEPLVGHPLLKPQVNIWSDRWRYCDSECEYYYFMDHSLADPFPEVRRVSLSDLKPSSTNPYYFNGHMFDNRPVFDPPSQVTVSDIPLDPGNCLRIDWDVSAQDDTIDCYNIYRWEADSSNATIEDYIYLTSVPKGTSSYLDTMVHYFDYYSYKVSAAHHGYYQTIPYGNYGIWNDFSMPSQGGMIAPVNNFFDISLSFPSAQYDTLRMCPEGDFDTIRVFLTVTGSDGSPTQNIPASDISLIDISHNPSYFCNTDHLHPVAATNEMGFTEFEFPFAGGCGSLNFQAIILDHYASGSLSTVVRSPDLNSNGRVILADFLIFSQTYNKRCGHPDYKECADYRPPFCYVNLPDFAEFSDHYNTCECR